MNSVGARILSVDEVTAGIAEKVRACGVMGKNAVPEPSIRSYGRFN